MQVQFNLILRSAHHTQAYLFTEGTKRNIKSHIKQYVLFCTKFNRNIVPADRDSLVAFFELFSLTASYDHLKNVYSSIKFLHKALNFPFIEEEFQVNTVLQSIKRKLAKVPFQVLPITPSILCSMYQYIKIENPADLALWCSFLVAFYCLFRKANVVPKSQSKFDPDKELSRAKITILEDDNVALIYSNFSKTNQFMNRDAVIPLCSNKVRALDPIYHLKMLMSHNIPANNPAFSYVKDNKIDFISYEKFTVRLKRLLDLAGYAPELYSGHSMRRGGCTLLFQLGCNPLIIQAIGDWKTDQYLKYCGLSFEQRWDAQLLMSSYTS